MNNSLPAKPGEGSLLERTCSCGHSSRWHSHDGMGDCEHDADCSCAAFSTDSLFVRHASVQAIEAALSNARAEAKIATMRADGLARLLEVRIEQIERGEWPVTEGSHEGGNR